MPIQLPIVWPQTFGKPFWSAEGQKNNDDDNAVLNADTTNL